MNYDVPCKGHLKLWSTFIYLEPFFVKSGILRTSVYNVYGSQNEFVDSVTRVHSAHAQSWSEWPSTTGCRICGSENYPHTKTTKPQLWALLCVAYIHKCILCISVTVSKLVSLNLLYISLVTISTVEPHDKELGTMKISLFRLVISGILLQRNTKSWNQENYIVMKGFCYISNLFITRFHCIDNQLCI